MSSNTNEAIFNNVFANNDNEGNDNDNEDEEDTWQISVSLTVFCVSLVAIFSLFIASLFLARIRCGSEREPAGTTDDHDYEETSQVRKEKRRQRKEFILQHMTVKEWHYPHGGETETTTSSKDLPTAPPSVSTTKSPQCAMGTDDAVDNDAAVAEEEEKTDCAICLCSFVAGQEVCGSNNAACHHVFHKSCMVGWLSKHEECPMCREIYLLDPIKTAVVPAEPTTTEEEEEDSSVAQALAARGTITQRFA